MKLVKWIFIVIAIVLAILAFIWFLNPGGLRDRVLVNQIVNMRVAPTRLENPKTPADYGMQYQDVDIMTDDGIRLSAWEIPAENDANKTVIVNHPLTTTRYGSVKGLDGVSVEFLPMIKHIHDAGYNVVMYDHRGQGDSDGGVGKAMKGQEAPVGAGVTEWQDVVGSLKYVQSHGTFSDDQIVFLSQCMGANATFLAWKQEPELFANDQIKSLIAIQPTLSYNMTDRFIRTKTGLNLVDQVLEQQREKYGFGFAESLENVSSVTVPVFYAQVEQDQYSFNQESGTNDIEEIIAATPTETEIVWIGPDQVKPFGTGKRFDGYGYFNENPEELLEFLDNSTQ